MASEDIAKQLKAVLERSRSGNGGHIWIFFDSPIQAVLARKLGSAVLTHTMDRDEQYSGIPIGTDLYGELRSIQKETASDILKHDIGVLARLKGYNAIGYSVRDVREESLDLPSGE